MKRFIYNSKTREPYRKELRNALTSAEAILWNHLKHRKLSDRKFRRQYSVGPYILDFYCPEIRLAIEVDGAVHFNPIAGEYDAKRDAYLAGRGIKVLRFENRCVYKELDWVLGMIRENLK